MDHVIGHLTAWELVFSAVASREGACPCALDSWLNITARCSRQDLCTPGSQSRTPLQPALQRQLAAVLRHLSGPPKAGRHLLHSSQARQRSLKAAVHRTCHGSAMCPRVSKTWCRACSKERVWAVSVRRRPSQQPQVLQSFCMQVRKSSIDSLNKQAKARTASLTARAVIADTCT